MVKHTVTNNLRLLQQFFQVTRDVQIVHGIQDTGAKILKSLKAINEQLVELVGVTKCGLAYGLCMGCRL